MKNYISLLASTFISINGKCDVCVKKQKKKKKKYKNFIKFFKVLFTNVKKRRFFTF